MTYNGGLYDAWNVLIVSVFVWHVESDVPPLKPVLLCCHTFLQKLTTCPDNTVNTRPALKNACKVLENIVDTHCVRDAEV